MKTNRSIFPSRWTVPTPQMERRTCSEEHNRFSPVQRVSWGFFSVSMSIVSDFHTDKLEEQKQARKNSLQGIYTGISCFTHQKPPVVFQWFHSSRTNRKRSSNASSWIGKRQQKKKKKISKHKPTTINNLGIKMPDKAA